MRKLECNFEMEPEWELINRVVSGETGLFERLMGPYCPRLLALARAALRNTADAEDVMQEVFLKVFTKLSQFRGEARFSSWLYRITFNEIRQYRRRHPIRLDAQVAFGDERDGLALPSTAPDALDNLEREHTRVAVAAVLSRLPAGMRTVLVSYHINELSLAGTASHLGVSEAAAKTRLFRARRYMHSAWESCFGERSQR